MTLVGQPLIIELFDPFGIKDEFFVRRETMLCNAMDEMTDTFYFATAGYCNFRTVTIRNRKSMQGLDSF